MAMPTSNSAASRRYATVVDALRAESRVTLETRKGFGSGALKVKGKIFAMLAPDGEYVVKLPKARVDQLVAAKKGKRFEPGPGRLMKEWFVVEAARLDWLELAREAYTFVSSSAK